MRFLTIAAVAAAVLLGARAARAEDPCAEDVKQLCGQVQIGGGRVQNCLRDNEARLSPACRTKREGVESRFRALVEEFALACRRDADRLCSEVNPGGGRIMACLVRQLDDLSGSCRAQAERFQTATETITMVRAACRADLERLCPGVTLDAASVVECLQGNREALSETCRNVDVPAAMAAAELVDAVAVLTSAERTQEALQVLQGLDSIAFSRSQILFQVDSYEGLVGAANADRLLFNPQAVFGRRNELAIQLKAPVLAVYPYATTRPAQTGLGAVSTALAWAFFTSARVHQYLSAALQWESPGQPPIGAPWAVTPGYAISVGVVRWLVVTGQIAWTRSFGSSGYPELDLLLVEPFVVVNLPGRSFLALDTRLGCNLVDRSFLPVLKGVAGLYMNRQKSLSISAWYQDSLSSAARAQLFGFGVGAGLAYFFDW